MPYEINKQDCEQSDGDDGSHVLSYTDKKGKKHDNCHTSKKKAQAQIGYIGELDETDDMVFGGGGDPEAEGEGEEDGMDEALLREWIREKLLAEAVLRAAELYKRPTAVEEYLKRVKESIPFEVSKKYGGGTITIPAAGNEALVAALELYATDPDASKEAFGDAWDAGVQTSDGIKRASGMLHKAKEFGGERAGKRLDKESGQIGQINAAIEAAGGSVSVDLGGRGGVVQDVTLCEQVTEGGMGGKDPKADAILKTADGTKVGELSLKYAAAPNQMSQWGGIQELYDAGVEYVVEFIKDVKYLEDDLGRLDKSYYREIDDPATAAKICFGGGGDLYTVGAIIASQTPITIDEGGFVADHVWTYPNVPDGDWYPTLWARFSTGRGGATSLKNVRLSLSPKGARTGDPLPARPATEEVEAPPPAEVEAVSDPVEESLLRALVREKLLLEKRAMQKIPGVFVMIDDEDEGSQAKFDKASASIRDLIKTLEAEPIDPEDVWDGFSIAASEEDAGVGSLTGSAQREDSEDFFQEIFAKIAGDDDADGKKWKHFQQVINSISGGGESAGIHGKIAKELEALIMKMTSDDVKRIASIPAATGFKAFMGEDLPKPPSGDFWTGIMAIAGGKQPAIGNGELYLAMIIEDASIGADVKEAGEEQRAVDVMVGDPSSPDQTLNVKKMDDGAKGATSSAKFYEALKSKLAARVYSQWPEYKDFVEQHRLDQKWENLSWENFMKLVEKSRLGDDKKRITALPTFQTPQNRKYAPKVFAMCGRLATTTELLKKAGEGGEHFTAEVKGGNVGKVVQLIDGEYSLPWNGMNSEGRSAYVYGKFNRLAGSEPFEVRPITAESSAQVVTLSASTLEQPADGITTAKGYSKKHDKKVRKWLEDSFNLNVIDLTDPQVKALTKMLFANKEIGKGGTGITFDTVATWWKGLPTADQKKLPLAESLLRNLIREKLILEALSASDKADVKRIIKKELSSAAAKKAIRKEIDGSSTKTMIDKAFKKQFDKELRAALGMSFFGTPGKINKFVVDAIHDEVEKILGDAATREMVVQICKDVIIKLYRELSFTYKPVIQRLKV